MMKTLLFILALFVASPAIAQPTPTPRVIDHTTIALYNVIPREAIDAGLALRSEFADRSVGGNISDGLKVCLSKDFTSAPTSCTTKKAGEPGETWTTAHDTSQITFNGWPGLGLPNPLTCTQSNGLWMNYLPCWKSSITPHLSEFDVVSMLWDYLAADWSDSMAGFFTIRTGPDNDIYDLQAFEDSLAADGKTMIYWGTSIANSNNTAMQQRMTDFNSTARAFHANTSHIFIDIGDIESHRPDGSECLQPSGLPKICDSWTTEVQGGHLNGAGKVRIAKAYEMALAYAAGWDPNPLPPVDTEPPRLGSACSGELFDQNPPPTEAECTFFFFDNIGITRVHVIMTVEDAAGNTSSDEFEYPLPVIPDPPLLPAIR